MDPERIVGTTVRCDKHRSRDSDRWMLPTPTVNSCKLTPVLVKSSAVENMTHYHRDIGKDKTVHFNPTLTQFDPGKMLNAFSQSRFVQTTADLSRTLQSNVPLATGFTAVIQAGRRSRDKSQRPVHSGSAAHCPNIPEQNKPGGVLGRFTPVPYNHFASNFNRLDLDRRGLKECPQSDMIEKLQLLNLQHNLITRIQHLSYLQQLVFLNLYDNQILEMSGIEALTSLRILMLGKNRIQKICCLDGLSKLNILDLHDNQICRIENLSRLSELRALNLAGNNIVKVENLHNLDSLTELNLRHNHISEVAEVDRLPCLQRLILSCNNITSLDQLVGLGQSPSLSQLTLDGNPVALETWYKQAVLRCVLHLRQLDMKRITDEDRRMAGVQARKEEEKKRESHKQTIHKVLHSCCCWINTSDMHQSLIRPRVDESPLTSVVHD
uniref:Leucine rich repeat containing 49 n=1 Tax=Cynoglossus semilaevis TaxID=244447 RepID=A0A3P8VT55_CYNSE